MQSWIIPAGVAFVCWGIWAFLPKLTTRFLDPPSAVLYEVLGAMLVAAAILIYLGFKPTVELRGVVPAVATGLLGVAGALAYLYAVTRGPVTLIATVTALYPVLAILLAAVFLQESVTLRQGLGVVLGLIAIVLISP